MRHRIRRRYIALLLIPFGVVLCLVAWLTLYTHAKGVEAMRQDVEKSNLRVAESVAATIDTLMEQVRLNASNLAIQIDKVSASTAYQLSLYRDTIDQMTYLQLNAASLLTPLVDRGYVFLFHENRAITQSSTAHVGRELYEKSFRFMNLDYDGFVRLFSGRYDAGTVLAEVEVGFLEETYRAWAMVQTIPADPTQTPIGVIVYTLDLTEMGRRLSEGLADEASLVLWDNGQGKRVVSQGRERRWMAEQVDDLMAHVDEGIQGVGYHTLSDGQRYLVTVAAADNGRVVTAQLDKDAFAGLRAYNTSMLIMALGMLLLCAGVVVIFTRRNVHSVQAVMNSIAPQNRSDSAADVFEYMQSAILSAQQKEAILSARADKQRELIRNIFLKRFLRGEYALDADLMRDQHLAGVPLEAEAYLVLLLRFADGQRKDAAAQERIARVMQDEFGADQALLVDMGHEDLACLVLAEEPEWRESIEAVADILMREMPLTIYASGTVTALTDVPRAYREVRVMARTQAAEPGRLMWYGELFLSDEPYSFEYDLQTETKLCNHIAAGNRAEAEAIFAALYETGIRGSLRSPRILRFLAYSLYRLVHLVGGEEGERKALRARLQVMMDGDMAEPRVFDSFFREVRDYCLKVCEQGSSRRSSGNSELLAQVLKHIDECYTDPALSVSSVAAKFMISDKYLSQFFREQTGGKISAYIEGKRIARACQLLDTTEMTINEIALASGYALTHTFRVAFKKLQGVTPVQWKKTRRGGE